MNLILAVIALITPLLLGMLLLALTGSEPPFRSRIGYLALGHMVGCGAVAMLLLLSQVVTGWLMIWPVYVVLLAAAAGSRRVRARFVRFLKPGESVAVAEGEWDVSLVKRALLGFVWLSVIVTIVVGLKGGLGWDAWTFWQLKARAFYIDGNMGFLRDAAHCFQQDYPPMIPLLSTWVFTHARSTADVWPQLIGAALYLDLLEIAYAVLRQWVSPTPTLACVALIASARMVQKYALAGYADVAAAAFMLTIAALLLRRFVDRDRSAGSPLLWTLGCAAMVKNETVAWVAASVALALVLGPGWRIRTAPLCVAAAAAGYLPWLWLQKHWSLHNTIAAQNAGAISLSFAFETATDVAMNFLRYSLLVGPQVPAWGLTALLAAAGLVNGLRRRDRRVLVLIVLLALQLAAYIGTLVWGIRAMPSWYSTYISDALPRFMLQMFPTLVLLSGIGCFAKKSFRLQD